MWKTVVLACIWSALCVDKAVAALPHPHDWWDLVYVAGTGTLAVCEWSDFARRRTAKRQ
jgi:hypothetical protein